MTQVRQQVLVWPEPVDDAVFAPHVVCFREQLALRWSTNDKFAIICVNDEVGEV